MATWKADNVIQLIREKRGNLSAVARELKVSRPTLYKYLESRTTVQDALEEARETMLDEAEAKLYEKVLNGDTAELIFFLKTRGKSRGYVERTEHTGADGDAIKIKGYATVSPDDWDDGDG